MKFYGNDVTSLAHRRLRPGFIDDPQFGSFLDALPDGAALLETDGTIKLVNSKLELLLNAARGELVGSDLGKQARTSGPVLQKLSTALQQLKRVELSGTLNSQRNVVASLSILRTPDGGAYGALLVMREPNRQARSADGSEKFRFQAEGVAGSNAAYAQTPSMQALIKLGTTALDRGSAVLLTGESGTGKTEFARRIGKAGEPGAPPFVHVNCGMLTDAAFDAEMFGIEPGSPLDTSTRGKLGYVEAADGGILFLDQVTDLSPTSQMKLVAFLEAQTFSRLGSAQRRQVSIRLITSTNRNLQDMVADGRFRDDLYYRIAVVSLALSPLRGQLELIRAIAERQIQRINLGRKPALQLSEGFWQRLLTYQYPGNIRELSNILEHAAASADDVVLSEHFVTPVTPLAPPLSFAGNVAESSVQPASFRDLVQEFESWVLEKSIAENGSKRSAAKALGIDIATLVRKTKRKR